jgi:peptidoglycan/LPS O-acetylase OafA/YrhL
VAGFFVLSGYLITRLVWRSGDGAGVSGYLAFLRRRFTRLAPALITFVVIWVLVVLMLGGEPIGSVLRSWALALTQISAYFLAVGGQENPGWGPTWSLSVEWCIYLLWPLVILLLRKGVTALTASRIAIGVGLIFYVVALPWTDVQFYFLPLAILSVLLWGGALALRHIRRAEAVESRSTGRDPAVVLLGIALLVALAAAPGDQGAGYRWLLLPAAVVGALIVVDGRPGAGGWGKSVSRAQAASWGWTSRVQHLSLYVPVMWLMYQVLPGRSPYLVAGLSMMVLVPVVVTSFELLERPWLSGSVTTSPRLPQITSAAYLG